MDESVRPADLTLRYEWNEGTMPPPYYYEYTIRIGPGTTGEIVFLPDYSIHQPPVWTERFPVEEAALDRLYALLLEKGILSRSWAERERMPVGGSTEWLEVTAHGRQVKISSRIEDVEAVAELYAAIRALVPAPIWQSLHARRAEFQRRFLEEEPD